MNRSKRPCLQPGCPNLVTSGYCDDHKPMIQRETNKNSIDWLRSLDNKKTEKEIKFYNSPAWIATSKRYRKKYPFCERCLQRGFYKPSKLVHHKKGVREIWKDNGNPLSWSYLQALCTNCHMEDLRKRINSNKNKKQYKY